MADVKEPERSNTGLLYRFNAGYRFRVGGSDAKNDGFLGEIDVGYVSKKYFDRFSIETGSSVDLFGETQHLGAYLQLNLHLGEKWIVSLRTMGGGVSDEKEKTKNNNPSIPTAANNSETEDEEDFGGAFDASLLASYRLDRNFLLGLRVGYTTQAFGEGSGDQGTQHSLSTYANLAYRF